MEVSFTVQTHFHQHNQQCDRQRFPSGYATVRPVFVVHFMVRIRGMTFSGVFAGVFLCVGVAQRRGRDIPPHFHTHHSHHGIQKREWVMLGSGVVRDFEEKSGWLRG